MVSALELAGAEIAKGATIADVARKVGCSRPSLSMFLDGKYPAGVTKLEARIVAALAHRVACPLEDGVAISGHQCRERADTPMPTGNPAEFQAWLACQACPNHKTGGSHAAR